MPWCFDTSSSDRRRDPRLSPGAPPYLGGAGTELTWDRLPRRSSSPACSRTRTTTWYSGTRTASSAKSAQVRQQLVVANLGPDIIPDSTRLPLVSAPAGVYRALANEFGMPDGTSTNASQPRGSWRSAAIRPVETSRRPADRCVPIGSSYLLPPTSTIMLRADTGNVHVRLRRFGGVWVSIGTIHDGTTSLVDLPGLQASKPWILQAPGACLVRDLPSSTIVRPKDNAELSGSTRLVAVPFGMCTNRVEFHLSGPGLQDTPIGNTVPVYGWFLQWDSTSVPNGEYALTSVVVDSAGNHDSSDAVRVTVNNRDR